MRETACSGGVGAKKVLLHQQHVAGGSVILLLVIALLVLTQLYLAIPLLPYIGQTFSSAAPKDLIFALASCFSLAYSLGFLFWGAVSDQYGRRPVMLAGMAVLTVATLACAFVPSLTWLAAARIVQGLAASSFAPVALAWLVESLPAQRRVTAVGAMSTAFLVAGIFGQVLAAWLALRWSWTWVFLATGACLFAATALAAVVIKEPVRASIDGHLWHRFIALGRLALQPPVLL